MKGSNNILSVTNFTNLFVPCIIIWCTIILACWPVRSTGVPASEFMKLSSWLRVPAWRSPQDTFQSHTHEIRSPPTTSSYPTPAHYPFGPIEHGAILFYPRPPILFLASLNMHLFPMRNEPCPAALDACERKMNDSNFFAPTTAIWLARRAKARANVPCPTDL